MLTLVTGASGFVGSAVVSELISRGLRVRAALRANSWTSSSCLREHYSVVSGVDEFTNWSPSLLGVDCIIHCAGLTTSTSKCEATALTAYRKVNVAGTKHLAEHAAVLGVRRFVFLSSIKVNGDQTERGSQFGPSDAVAPVDPYGISKWEAEQALWALSRKTGLEVVVIRLPLVYGAEVKGNLLRLLSWVASGVPLPLGAVHNQRSLLGLSNLVDLLLLCAEHPAASGQTFMASDCHDLSTPELIHLIAAGMNRSARLLPLPGQLLRAVGSLLGKFSEVNRLVGSLQVDCGHTQAQLDWTPAVSVEVGVREMARWYVGLQDARA